ncbi:MAG: PD-(D/E)XK nuclease family protein [Aequorivita sp.]
MDYKILKTLFNDSGVIVKTHLQNMCEKGEDFNVFSILGMETNETKTHSAMLVALLDPRGNHYYGKRFLEFFLEEIGYKDYQDEDLMGVRVKAEYHLGKISEEDESGGFIDILITFPSGKAIIIENKIDAKDQPKQMYRYSLFKGGASALYYLSKLGEPPTKESLFNLTDKDYEVISYNREIVSWLEKCLSITREGSIVENAIKQYQILIKNLTNTMEKPLEKELTELIVNSLEEAKYIHSHYQKAVDSIREKFRLAVLKKLNSMQFVVQARLGNPINHNYSQIWLTSETLHEKELQFGIESFSGKGNNNGRVFIGIFDRKNKYNAIRDGDYRLSSYWPLVCDITTPDKNPLNLSSTKTLERLSKDSVYFEEIVNEITTQIIDFVKVYHALFV